jgi:uncharacterized membrane protein YphA (DoxX/SURF4 family)
VTRTLLALARVGVGALFLYAAATKVPDMALFAEEVANYRLLPAAAVPAVAALVVGIEIVAGLALVAGVLTRAAAVAVSGLMVVFIAGLTQALVRGIDLTCGCFGGKESATWWTVVRDVAILLPALAVALRGGGQLLPSRDGRAAERPAPESP